MFSPRHAFLRRTKARSAEGLFDTFHTEIRETFGALVPPRGDHSPLWELTLHGITATGATEREAMANWQRIAQRHCDTDAAQTPAMGALSHI